MHRSAPDASPSSLRFSGVVFRYADYDTPVWARANTAAGRWNESRTVATQYFSTTPEAVWAELGRVEILRTDAEFATVQTTIWAVQVDQAHIADYGTLEKAAAAGFPPDALIDDDHQRCQREAVRLQEAGFQGVIAPSAALPGAQSVTLFGPRVRSAWGQPPLLASSIPCCAVARGSPAVPLADRVRYYGAAHPELAAFIAGRRGDETNSA